MCECVAPVRTILTGSPSGICSEHDISAASESTHRGVEPRRDRSRDTVVVAQKGGSAAASAAPSRSSRLEPARDNARDKVVPFQARVPSLKAAGVGTWRPHSGSATAAVASRRRAPSSSPANRAFGRVCGGKSQAENPPFQSVHE